jgi:hypothetical protein
MMAQLYLLTNSLSNHLVDDCMHNPLVNIVGSNGSISTSNQTHFPLLLLEIFTLTFCQSSFETHQREKLVVTLKQEVFGIKDQHLLLGLIVQCAEFSGVVPTKVVHVCRRMFGSSVHLVHSVSPMPVR